MGIDFSHGGACWAYTGFGKFREWVCADAGLGLLREYVGFGGVESWPEHPLTPFLNHSDCDGALTPAECVLVAPALLETVLKMTDEYDREMGLRLVAGMLLAVADGVVLEFR